MLGALTGLRLGEILWLKWSPVDFVPRRLPNHEQAGSSTTKAGAECFVETAGSAATRPSPGCSDGGPDQQAPTDGTLPCSEAQADATGRR